jgi:hypothetical protein
MVFVWEIKFNGETKHTISGSAHHAVYQAMRGSKAINGVINFNRGRLVKNILCKECGQKYWDIYAQEEHENKGTHAWIIKNKRSV